VVRILCLYTVCFRAELDWSVETWSRLLLLCRCIHTKTSANGVLCDSKRTFPAPSERAFRGVRKIADSEYKLRLVCPSARVEQLGSHWTDFHEIWYLIFRRSMYKIQISLDGFSWNLILRIFWKSIYKIQISLDGFSWNLIFFENLSIKFKVHSTDFHEIYLIFRKSIYKIQISVDGFSWNLILDFSKIRL